MTEFNRSMNVMSLLTIDEVQRLNGLPEMAIIASYQGDQPPEVIQGNPSFIQFMHHVIRTRATEDPDLVAAARAKGDGVLMILDANTPQVPPEQLPHEDIIGAFQVSGGRLTPESYSANPRYCAYRRARGGAKLPGRLHALLLETLRNLPPRPNPNPTPNPA